MTDQRVIRLDLEYDGTDFLGWQQQKTGRTVQGELARALRRFLQEETHPFGSGRTDAGTHARGLVAHVTTTSHHDPERFRRALNGLLPPDVGVRRALEVSADFHARFSTRGKRYRYRIAFAPLPLHRYQTWVMPRPLDLERMQEAAGLLSGKHSFRAFCNPHPTPDHHDCTIHEASWSITPEEFVFEVTGDRFLRHMVRILVGTMVEVGEAKRSIEQFSQLLTSPGERTDAGQTVPSRGLCLLGVLYDEADGGPSGDLRL
ncbi:MAG: tRNA pseudouridine(38-40) synthase TruA [Gemmatimonadetes bacterium]|nr:tRNA pseudouridine(38-40) synthase TruA [Gemmatimonadota bacterium]